MRECRNDEYVSGMSLMSLNSVLHENMAYVVYWLGGGGEGKQMEKETKVRPEPDGFDDQ